MGRRIVYILEAGILWCLVSLGFFNKDNIYYSLFLIILIGMQLFYEIYRKNKGKQESIFLLVCFLGFFLRLGFMYYDIFVNEIDPGDCRDFRLSAEHFFFTNEVNFRGVYSNTTLFMGLICKIFGPQRVILQYIGTICFIIAVMNTYEILKILKINWGIRIIVIIWMLFTPQNIKNTSLSNREGFISFFITLSLLYFFKWFLKKDAKNIIHSILFALFGALLHSGVVCLIVGIFFAYAFYDRDKQRMTYRIKTMTFFAILVGLSVLLYINFKEILFEKFRDFDSIAVLARKAMAVEIEDSSSYNIAGDQAESIIDILYYSPLRIIYFLLSPMPWDWRGITDALAFLSCSVPQLIIMYQSFNIMLENVEISKEQRTFMLILLIIAMSIGVVFGWGVRNAGTAIRHRDKFLSLYTIMLGISLNYQFKWNKAKNHRKLRARLQ